MLAPYIYPTYTVEPLYKDRTEIRTPQNTVVGPSYMYMYIY